MATGYEIVSPIVISRVVPGGAYLMEGEILGTAIPLADEWMPTAAHVVDEFPEPGGERVPIVGIRQSTEGRLKGAEIREVERLEADLALLRIDYLLPGSQNWMHRVPWCPRELPVFETVRSLGYAYGIYRCGEDVRVVVDDEGVRCTHPDGRADAVGWSELQEAGVETNSYGPFIEDVYFYLEGSEYAFYVPQAAQGTDELVRRLTELPGFDGEAFVEAMCSTSNIRFVCWRRGEHERTGTCGDDGNLV